ncbi:MAG TPA: universal stress protein [Acidimicrobiales bacterium]|nr:universal stress protein [Acidimicrobiales bacterium]
MPRQRIVVGVDGSDASKEALRWAAAQAEATGASLRVVIAWEFPAAWGGVPLPASYDPEQSARQAAEEVIDEVLGADRRPDVRLDVVESRPAPALIEAARGADLLVVGSRGHGAFTGMLLGSVSQHCVGHAPCPVVVVRARPEAPDAGDP